MNKNARPMVACKARTIITILLVLVATAGQGQEIKMNEPSFSDSSSAASMPRPIWPIGADYQESIKH